MGSPDWGTAGVVAALPRVALDAERSIILVTNDGFHGPDALDEHFAQLGDMVQKVRTAGRPIRVLLDVRDAPVNGPEAAARIKAASASLYRTGDRVAILGASALLRSQARRLELACHEMFGEVADAQDWLRSA